MIVDGADFSESFEFRPGQRVVKILHGVGGWREASIHTVASVEKGVVVLEEGKGITYSATSGKELELFFLPMYAEITPLDE